MEPMDRMECMKLLMQCIDLFQPENCHFYGQFSRNGDFMKMMTEPERIPDGLPGDQKALDELANRIYAGMLRLDLPQQYLGYPNLAEAIERVNVLCFEECAQFLLYYARAHLRGGWEFFFRTWREGNTLRILRRMISQMDSYQFAEEHPKEIASIKLELGDITAVQADYVVNPTDERFSGGGGVDRLLHKKAGAALREVCRKIGHLPVGEAVVTAGFDLPAGSIIHVSVPTQGQPDTPYLLASCYANALSLAQSRWGNTVAFPAMGSGNAGIPAVEALWIGARTLWDWTRRNPGRPMTVKVLFTSEEKLEIFRKALMLCIVRDFRRIADPAAMGAGMRHSLTYLLEEHGGLVQLPPEKKRQADLGRKMLTQLHEQYSHLAFLLYELIGKPDYGNVLQQVSSIHKNPVDEFMEHLDDMGEKECVSWLIFLQRMDYGSGGASGIHIRNCANGRVLRVLDHMERLLSVQLRYWK